VLFVGNVIYLSIFGKECVVSYVNTCTENIVIYPSIILIVNSKYIYR